jgi:pimeloyl-ACP methyl ester carboxylesterase
VFVLVYALYAVAMVKGHPSFIYPFAQEPFVLDGFEQMVLPSAQGPVTIEMRFAAPDAPVVLFFMGNSGTLAYHLPPMLAHIAAGRTVRALAYPGGGGVPGAPSEALLKAQALVAYDWLDARSEQPIIVHGYSMGSGLALHVAANRTVKSVILDAPFARICDLMTRASWLPACYLPGIQTWDNLAYAGSIHAPVLIQHGNDDMVIPPADSLRLWQALHAADVPGIYTAYPHRGHGDLANDPAYGAAMTQFLGDL